MEKKIENIGKDKNNTTVCKLSAKSNLLAINRCQTIRIVNTATKLNIGRAYIKQLFN